MAFGLALAALMTGAAQAQDAAPSGAPPPSWQALIHCAKLPDDDSQLACFRAAMKAAGYEANPQEVTAERHHRFGLAAPQLGFLKRHSQAEGQAAGSQGATPPAAPPAQTSAAASPPPPPGLKAAPEDENHVFVQIEKIASEPPLGRMLIVTSDGGIWEQIDSETVAPFPKPGQSIEIRRNAFGGYLCIFDKHQGVRCARVR